MELKLMFLFFFLLIIQHAKTSDVTSICEGQRNGIFAAGVCQAGFIICTNGVERGDACKMGFLYDESDGLCKTPHEQFCSHLIEENAERECKVEDVSDDHMLASGFLSVPVKDRTHQASSFNRITPQDNFVKAVPLRHEHTHSHTFDAAAIETLEPLSDFHRVAVPIAADLEDDNDHMLASTFIQDPIKDDYHLPASTFAQVPLNKRPHLAASTFTQVPVKEEPLGKASTFTQGPSKEDSLWSTSTFAQVPLNRESPLAAATFAQNPWKEESHVAASTFVQVPINAEPHSVASTFTQVPVNEDYHLPASTFAQGSLNKESHLTASTFTQVPVKEEPLRKASTFAQVPSKEDSLWSASTFTQDSLKEDSHEAASTFAQVSVNTEPHLIASTFEHVPVKEDYHLPASTFAQIPLNKESPVAAATFAQNPWKEESHVAASTFVQVPVNAEPHSVASTFTQVPVKEEPLGRASTFTQVPLNENPHLVASTVTQVPVKEEPVGGASTFVQGSLDKESHVEASKFAKVPSRKKSHWSASTFAQVPLNEATVWSDQFDGDALPSVLHNPFVQVPSKDLWSDQFDGDAIPSVLQNPFVQAKEGSLLSDQFDGDAIPSILNNPFAHFPEKEKSKYNYERHLEDIDEGSGSGMEDDGDVELFWRKKRSVSFEDCPVKQRSYRPQISVFGSSQARNNVVIPSPSLFDWLERAPVASTAVDPQCYNRDDGYTYSNGPCRSLFYKCVKGRKIRYHCSQNGIFSETKNTCISRADSLECRPPKPKTDIIHGNSDTATFCVDRPDGLYRHPITCQRVIHCFDSVAFEYPKCSHGLAFDERRGVCDYRQNVPGCETFGDETTSTQPQSVIGCGQYSHGDHIPNEKDCNSFYRCVWNTMELMKCPATTVFNPKLDVCDYPNQVQCPATN